MSLAAGRGALRLRYHMRAWALLGDLVALTLSFAGALLFFAWFHSYDLHGATDTFYWGLPMGAVAALASFFLSGLYKVEAWVSRPLHVAVLFKASLIGLVITAFVTFTFRIELATMSRLFVFGVFALLFVTAALIRIGLVDRLYRTDLRRRSGETFVIGESLEDGMLATRLRELRGFSPVRALDPAHDGNNSADADAGVIAALESAEPAPRNVFIDEVSLGHKAALDLVAAARARGAEVYVSGPLVSALDATRLLLRLFEMPVMRVRRDPPPLGAATTAGQKIAAGDQPTSTTGPRSSPGGLFKRAFDIVFASLVLLVFWPVVLVIAIAIKLDSPGPVFYRQQRVGLHGKRFTFLKFRSMKTGNDPAEHRDYVCRLIESGDMACVDENGDSIYKLADDDRVTGVGRFLRKWSIDETPQFWNVLRGDMSVVGPRPALDYEVEVYKEWHRLRLEVMPGVSGLWQIAGRSRVGFDEMVFQDVMYGYNQSLLTDVNIILRTVPAVLMGRGAV